MEVHKDLPVYLFSTRQEFRDWLVQHHAQPTGIWLKLAKKNASIPTITYEEAVEEALCFGWIDSLVNSYNENFKLQKFTQRKPKSVWSKINIGRVEALIKAGKMQPAGLAAIEIAKQHGSWDKAYDSGKTMTMPEDFRKALDENPKAKAFYETLNKTSTYAFYWRIQTAIKPETRKARIEKFITMLSNHETLH